MELFLICNSFPYGKGDSFLKNELPYLSKRFDMVTIFNLDKLDIENVITLPPNVKVVNQSIISIKTTRSSIFITSFWFVFKTLLVEWKSCKYKLFFIKKLRYFISELINSIVFAKKIEKIGFEKGSTIFYSFWMNSGALALSYLKHHQKIRAFVFRVHGFDLYKERHPDNYLPFRKTNFSYADKIFTISEVGRQYIKDNYDNYKKVQTAYLGTQFFGINPFEKHIHTVVSCSSIITLKRLSLICAALQGIKDMEIKWVHFGDGPLKEDLVKASKKMPENIHIILFGFVTGEVLFEFYRSNPVSLFINVSETEGLPVSIMEAISFGIPIMATNVGGTSEIVTSETGILLNKDIKKDELSTRIKDTLTGDLNSLVFREQIVQFWKQNFSAEKNYNDFCDALYTLRKE